MKRVIVLIIACLVFVAGMTPALAASTENKTVTVYVNGKKVSFERPAVLVNNRVMVPARTAFGKLDATVDWYEKDGTVKIRKNSIVVSMKISDKRMTVNNTYANMDVSPELINGTVMVPASFAAKALNIDVKWDSKKRAVYLKGTSTSRGDTARAFVVVVDAGHGGVEPGAINFGIKEKDLNLDIAKRLNTLLREEGIKTYMTRTGDSYVGLYERSGLANKVKADLLVSVHNNADGTGRTKGAMTLYYPYGGNSKGKLTAKRFADIVQDRLVADLGAADLGIIKRPHLAVLRTADMPAVIAEIGYMDNRTEMAKLKTADYKQKAAESLKDAVLAALKEI